MEEKYGGIWVSAEEDGAAKVVSEEYIPSVEKLLVIYQQENGAFLPFSFVLKQDHQLRLPIWSPENQKAMMPTFDSAKEYLKSYAGSYT
ncbi:hypothetical protein JF541_16190 [Marinobacter hydrocarbonoclasticus]|uniref:hypothetical protein n=1 Tax=Marinobacter nauticus TaxID=2743 RepID=UPI001A8ED17C|nr:hypothetical protein [Marinobacter nauticus]MBN8240701.1 hypothetical protein [Marinobacter nauticus]